jgi:Host cell surface-exposed lipoprotein
VAAATLKRAVDGMGCGGGWWCRRIAASGHKGAGRMTESEHDLEQNPATGEVPMSGERVALEDPTETSTTPPKKRVGRIGNVITLGCIGLTALVIIGALAVGGSSHVKPSGSTSLPTYSTPSNYTGSTQPVAPPAPTLAQKQVIDAAKSYLSMGSGFSRSGLIEQLHSKAGGGFPKAVAAYAVNHLHVDWNQQAVESAKGSLSMGGFSRNSLINQLSSKAGEGFTRAQAAYAVNKVGL